ncbi:MAG: FtsH protease activity modulator HflK [Planctomycetes bacterium]|nr:FtsH protease activity modulator HflK [Planctomycetota bacterium]MBL7042651.1 FtsH protease activity modulator HflK [Pirellulaceae bacterium]
MKRIVLLVFVCLLAYLATGLYFVRTDEQVVVRRFGRVLVEPREPGPYFGLPWGLDRIDRVKPSEVKRVTIGPLNLGGEAVGASLSQFLTGDRNLVNVRATVQYTIKEPARDYLFNSTAVDPLVVSAGEAAMTRVLAEHSVDHALTLGKREVAILIRERLQAAVDQYQLGVTIRSLDIGAVEPPAEVAEAFDKVVGALRQREQQINEADSYRRRTLAQAQADAQRIRYESRSSHDRRLREAEGETERFDRLLAEYTQSPALTARRMYLDAMAETLPKFRSKLIVDSGTEIDLSIIRGEGR